MNYFHIKDANSYNQTYSQMKKYLDSLKKTIDLKKVFSHQNTSKNMYLVQKIYQKKIGDGRLDESTFLKESNQSERRPARVTPFARKAPLAHKTASNLSHRILSFDNCEMGQENRAFAENKKDEKANLQFFSKLKLHPTPKTTLIKATPMS